MAIPEGHKANFNTLLRAAEDGALMLVECTSAVTGAQIFTVCAVERDGADYVFVPLAKMFDGNPYEELNPPE